MRSYLGTAWLIAMIGLACSGGGDDLTSIELPIASLTITNKQICNGRPIGTTCSYQVVAMTAQGQQIANPVVRWASSNSSIISVDPESGVAETRSDGTTTVQVANSTDTVRDAAPVWVLTPNPK